jgi:hypothetical protein
MPRAELRLRYRRKSMFKTEPHAESVRLLQSQFFSLMLIFFVFFVIMGTLSLSAFLRLMLLLLSVGLAGVLLLRDS